MAKTENVIYTVCFAFQFCKGFIGYAPEVYKLMTAHPVKDTDDDQLYYTQLYLDEDFRVSKNAFLNSIVIVLKHTCLF